MDEKKTARAEAKYVRIAPRKIQIICDMIRGEKNGPGNGLHEEHSESRL